MNLNYNFIANHLFLSVFIMYIVVIIPLALLSGSFFQRMNDLDKKLSKEHGDVL